MGRVTVVGLGPAGPELVPPAGAAAIAEVEERFVRTRRHRSAVVVEPAESFDSLYEAAASLDDVYSGIVERLVAAAAASGHVLYAVPGSPLVAERSVALLLADPRAEVDVVVAPSFVDLVWARLGVDPVDAGVRLVDGRRFAVEAAGERGPMLVSQCDSIHVLSDIKLAVEGDPPAEVVVLQRLGLPDEAVTTVGWDDLDRKVVPDHLTSLYLPAMAAPVAGELARFAELVRALRQRCPWDREQTHRSLTRHLLDETYELLEAIEALDGSSPPHVTWDHLEEELGDLLFQVVFHATLAGEEGAFTLADVARTVHDKLVARHPHVFGDVVAETAGQVMANWEQAKKAEKGRASLMDGIPGALPALLYAHKVQRKAASVGFDWPTVDDVYPKVTEELDELRRDPGPEELGDLLFTVVNVARHLGVDPEDALRSATSKFRRRFEAVELLAASQGAELRSLDLAALDALWEAVKAQ